MSANLEEIVLDLLPNRESVLHYIWGNLRGPLEPHLGDFLANKVGDYGSWKEKYLDSGSLYFQGWIYREKKQGHWLYNFKNGSPHKDCYYRNNEYHNHCKLWNIDGSYEIVDYYKGKIHGKRLKFYSGGVMYQKHIYEMGKRKEFYGPVELGLYNSP